MLSWAKTYSGVFVLGQDEASLTFAADRESHGAFLEQLRDSHGETTDSMLHFQKHVCLGACRPPLDDPKFPM